MEVHNLVYDHCLAGVHVWTTNVRHTNTDGDGSRQWYKNSIWFITTDEAGAASQHNRRPASPGVQWHPVFTQPATTGVQVVHGKPDVWRQVPRISRWVPLCCARILRRRTRSGWFQVAFPIALTSAILNCISWSVASYVGHRFYAPQLARQVLLSKGAGSGMAGMAAAIPIQNLVWRRHTNQK